MLSVENVCYRYKNSSVDALKNITASFEAGRLHAIVGPSGSGKTTLLSIMAGLDRPTSGRVRISGTDLSKLDMDIYRRERIAMIFQAFQLFPLLTAIENVCYPMEANGKQSKYVRQHAAQLLAAVGIGEEKHKRYPSNLSGGEQQRVAIARALASGARVLLADEPTGNLDEINGKAVLHLLRHLAHEEKYAVIIVTHNADIAAACDEIFRIQDGELAVIT